MVAKNLSDVDNPNVTDRDESRKPFRGLSDQAVAPSFGKNDIVSYKPMPSR